MLVETALFIITTVLSSGMTIELTDEENELALEKCIEWKKDWVMLQGLHQGINPFTYKGYDTALDVAYNKGNSNYAELLPTLKLFQGIIYAVPIEGCVPNEQ